MKSEVTFFPKVLYLQIGAEGESGEPRFVPTHIIEKAALETNQWESVERVVIVPEKDAHLHPHYVDILKALYSSVSFQRVEITQFSAIENLNETILSAHLTVPAINNLVFCGNPDDNAEKLLSDLHSRAKAINPKLKVSLVNNGNVLLINGGEKLVPHPIPHSTAEANSEPSRFGGCPFVETDSLFISATGRVVPCPVMKSESFSFGRLPDDGFGDLMNCALYNRIRHLTRLDRRVELESCALCRLGLATLLDWECLSEFWLNRDDMLLVGDKEERRYIFEELLSIEHRAVRVDLGCGKSKLPGFIGVDRFDLPGVDVIADIESPLPFEDSSVDLLYASHSLEHTQNFFAVFSEIYRALKHGGQLVIIAPYFFQHLDASNPYHHIAFTEHTPRFLTSRNTNFTGRQIKNHPQASTLSLKESDHSKSEIDLVCLKMEFFYFDEYRLLSEEEKEAARESKLNVCDQIMYHFIAVKEGTSDEEIMKMAKNIRYFEPPYITVRKLKEEGERVASDLEKLRKKLDEREELIGSLAAKIKEMEAEKQILENELKMVSESYKSVLAELSDIKSKPLFRFLGRRALQTDLWHSLPESLNGIKRDMTRFGGDIKDFRLERSKDLSAVEFLHYELDILPNLVAVAIVPFFRLKPVRGELGIEIVTKEGSILHNATVPAESLKSESPVWFELPPAGWGVKTVNLRVFARNLQYPISILEMNKYVLRGLSAVRSKAFTGFRFRS
ncbi:MAG: hypothetical protein Kow0090_07550 [Myxococcota bacterium]